VLKWGEDIFNPTIGNESNDNGVRIVNFAISKNLVAKAKMFPHRNLHTYIWTCPDMKTHNQIYHILIDRRWHTSIHDVRSFRGADSDTDHSLVVSKVKEWLTVSKEAQQKFDVKRFDIRKQSELKVRKEYQIKRRGSYRVLAGKPEEKRSLGCPKRVWEDNIKMELQEVGWGIDWIDLDQDMDKCLA